MNRNSFDRSSIGIVGRSYQCVVIVNEGNYFTHPVYDARGVVFITAREQRWIPLASDYALYFPIAGSEAAPHSKGAPMWRNRIQLYYFTLTVQGMILCRLHTVRNTPCITLMLECGSPL